MSILISLFVNLLPLYTLIALGYFAGRKLDVDRHTIGNLAIYIFMPVVVFGFVVGLDFKVKYICLPFVMYAISTITAFSFLHIGKNIYVDKQANLLALCTSMGNSGYFGLPLVMLFFDKDMVAIYIFMILGGIIFESTIGYYIAARGRFDVRQSIFKLLNLPAIYSLFLAFLIKYMGVEIPNIFWDYWAYFKGAYVITGMMIIGVSLSNIEKFVLGKRFILLVFVGKFVVYPSLAFGFVVLDKYMLHMLSNNLYKLIMIMSIVPTAANVATFASQMNLEPEKAATTILIGTIFALFYIPFMIYLIGI